MTDNEQQQQRHWPKYFYVLVPFVVTVLTVVLIEVLLALFWPVPPSMSTNMYYRADPITGFAHEPNAVGRYPTGITAVANSHGLRDHEVTLQKPANTRRILVLGDSFTVGVNVEMEDAYPQVLERMMNDGSEAPVEVINAALGGSSPFQYAQYFEHHGAQYSPDEVLVGFFVGNDTYDGATSVEQLSTAINGQRVSREMAQGGLVQLRIMLHQSFNLVRLLQGASIISVPAIRQQCDDFGKNLLNIAAHRLTNHRVDLGASAQFSANAVNQIQRINLTADRMGIPLTVILIPDELQVSQELRDRVVTQDTLDLYDFELPQKQLINEFAALGIETFDLRPFFSQDEDCLYMNDTHWNPQGHIVAATAIAQKISSPAVKPVDSVAKEHPMAVPPSTKKALSIEEAVDAIQSYVGVLQKTSESGPMVSDSRLLPLPKERIKAAATMLYWHATDAKERASFITVAKSLALFQANVGDFPSSLDSKRSDGTIWRSIVEPEMQKIEQAFAKTE